MRVRMIQLRILGATLTGLWIAACILVLLGYRPGGPVDLWVGLAAAGPIAIGVVAVVWPPVARSDRAFAAIAWLGLVAVLLLIPSLAGLVTQLAGRGPQTLLPSLEAAYPWLLALTATSVFAGLGIARRRLGDTALRRRRMVMGGILGAVFVIASGGLFTVAAVVNELALDDRPAITSRFGPTDPTLTTPQCNEPLAVGPTARVQLQMDAAIDDKRTGQALIDGVRDGTDVRWTGFAASRFTLGQHGASRIGDQGWLLGPGTGWLPVSAERAAGNSLDAQLAAVALTAGNRAVAEDAGLAYIEGARARHCRITIDGGTLRRALPEVELLVGQVDLSRWRGDLDYWVFADGQLGQVDAHLTGPATGLAEDALLATIRFRMTAVDRGQPVSIVAPTS